MGNHASSDHRPTRKVILLDGSIQETNNNNPLTVAELMLDHPQQVVVELNSGCGKPTPLPADFKLEPNKVYLMVPIRRGKPAQLSPQEAQQILLRANAVLRSKALVSTSKFLPFFSKICPASTLDGSYGKVVDRTKTGLLASEEEEEIGGLERPDYLSRTVSGKGWKPSLNTIEEKNKNEMKRAVNLAILASKLGKRIEKKGLVWG